jgi:hypothetical protein
LGFFKFAVDTACHFRNSRKLAQRFRAVYPSEARVHKRICKPQSDQAALQQLCMLAKIEPQAYEVSVEPMDTVAGGNPSEAECGHRILTLAVHGRSSWQSIWKVNSMPGNNSPWIPGKKSYNTRLLSSAMRAEYR